MTSRPFNFSSASSWRATRISLLPALSEAGVPLSKRVFGIGHYLRAPMIQLIGCTNVLLQGYRVQNTPFWQHHPVHCRNLVIRNESFDAIVAGQVSDYDVAFSQISITRGGRVVGSLNESHLYQQFLDNPGIKREPVEHIMQPAFPFVDISTPVQLLSTMITAQNPAVLVRDFTTEKTFIITRSDLIRVL